MAWPGTCAWSAGRFPWIHAPELADRIGGFDPEAGMMCVYGKDEAALRELGLILSSAFHDRAKLAALIEATDPGDWD
ncbi:Imm51 family immunity protein [Streptomyces adelaidensis]|uniref:Imm51 family immunity protein n=1 Tax=Streptomyces adelaidensis TaxID=2796465 RepID=UPI001907CF20|nr:Imm51 family immunity protein [Streptomyces adelaidensis]